MNHLPSKISEKLENLPRRPGVYLFKDKKGEIIYIGKAKILRNRVRSYFQEGRILDIKQIHMTDRIQDFETIITDSEVEALILESNLVKEYKPRYNINLKDDKSFPYIRITNEPFPRVFPTRKIIQDGSRYFGPYTDVGSLRELFKTVKRIFPFRSCNLVINDATLAQKKYRVCLNYHIKRCHGPCEGFISRAEYKELIDHVADFIQGKTEKVIAEIKNRMYAASEKLRFEEAARMRDQLSSIEMFQNRQKVVDPLKMDRDIIAAAIEDGDACCVVFRVREGKIIGRQHFYMNNVENESLGSVAGAFVKQYYLSADYVPKQILLPVPLQEDKEAILDWLTQKRSDKVDLAVPMRGEKAELMRMCQKNAQLLLEELQLQKLKAEDFIAGSVKSLQNELKLSKTPVRIEAFDISNIQGTDPVASLVCFVNGKALKSEYRHFRIRGKSTPDDFAMMREVVGRRYSRILKEEKILPDLILVDGGKGQLSAARESLEKLGLLEQPIIALAKRLDEVFLPGLSDPQNIHRNSSGLRLLQRIRDEAHRFAVTHHRKVRKKRTLISAIDNVQGIGVMRRNQLIRHFGSIENLKNASLDEIQLVKGISKPVAQRLWEFFHPAEL